MRPLRSQQTLTRRQLIGSPTGAPPPQRTPQAPPQAPPQAGTHSTSQAAASVPQAGPPTAFGDLDVVLAHHATQGFTTATLTEIKTIGRAAWIDAQLHPDSIADPVADSFVASLPSVGMTVAEIDVAYGPDSITVAEELQQACIGRSVTSRRQLFERVVEFWNDHFNIDQLQTHLGRFYFTHYDREIIRPLALGNFEDLLVETAKSAAMLSYLNGDVNVVGAANENYAREVMELHTLGVDGPYTEPDVQDLARCFTGWRFLRMHESVPGEFFFDAANHDVDPKTVLGVSIPAGGGVDEGLTLLHELAIHPKTLDYVSRKLVSWLGSYDPPQAAVDLVVARWQATNGDLKEVVREALSDDVLRLCNAAAARKLKRPFHFAVGLMRQLGVETTDAFRGTSRMLSAVGQRPYAWAPPDGYPDTLAAWGADAYGRWNFASALLAGTFPGATVPSTSLVALQGSTPFAELAEHFADLLGGGLMNPVEVERVQAFIDASPATSTTLREAIALLASCPSYQLY